MRKSALLITAAVLAFSLPSVASADNSNGLRLLGDALHQVVVPMESVAGPAKAAPAMKAKKVKKHKKAKKAKAKKAKTTKKADKKMMDAKPKKTTKKKM